MIENQNKKLSLVGETVIINYVSDPFIGNGKFHIENFTTNPVSARVDSAWSKIGDYEKILTDITVFNLDTLQAVDSQSFVINPGTTMKFLLGFPVIQYDPHFGETGFVGLRLIVNGYKIEAESPIQFVRRFPRS